MKLQEIVMVESKIPTMGVPGVKVDVLHTERSQLLKALKELKCSIAGQGYSGGSTKWSVTFYLPKKFDLEKFKDQLREKMNYDGWLDVDFFDLEEE